MYIQAISVARITCKELQSNSPLIAIHIYVHLYYKYNETICIHLLNIYFRFISDFNTFSICSLIVISKLLQFWIRIFSSFHCKIEVISYLMGSKTKLSSEKKNNIRCIMHVLDLRIPASAY